MFSRYRLLRFLGGPPPDMVSLTRDEQTGASMVLHMLPEALGAECPERLDILEETLELLSEDPVPGVPQVGSWDLDGETPGFTEMYIPGRSLSSLLSQTMGKGQRLPHAAAAAIILRIARVLEGAHKLDMVHGDLRPAKILIEKKEVHILGYPWSAFRPFAFEKSPPTTLAHLPPEALSGAKPNVRWDIYQLGLIAYQIYTGERPFPDLEGLAAAQHRLSNDIPPVGERRHYFPKDLQEIVMVLLANDPAKRFASARAFRKAMESYLRKAKNGPVELVESAAVTSRKFVRPRKTRRKIKEAPLILPQMPVKEEEPPPRVQMPKIPPILIELIAACLLFIFSGILVITSSPSPSSLPPRIVVKAAFPKGGQP